MGRKYAANFLKALFIVLLGISFVFISNSVNQKKTTEASSAQTLSMNKVDLIGTSYSELDPDDDSDEDSILQDSVLMDELTREQEFKVDALVK